MTLLFRHFCAFVISAVLGHERSSCSSCGVYNRYIVFECLSVRSWKYKQPQCADDGQRRNVTGVFTIPKVSIHSAWTVIVVLLMFFALLCLCFCSWLLNFGTPFQLKKHLKFVSLFLLRLLVFVFSRQNYATSIDRVTWKSHRDNWPPPHPIKMGGRVSPRSPRDPLNPFGWAVIFFGKSFRSQTTQPPTHSHTHIPPEKLVMFISAKKERRVDQARILALSGMVC